MEKIDVLDEQGNFTGVVKDRKSVHKDGDWHRTVHIWIINSREQLLLQQRHPRKYSHPGMWDISAAGHISAGGDSLPSAIREVHEELGLMLEPEEMEYVFTAKDTDVIGNGYVDNEFHDVYLVSKDVDLSTLVFQDGEVIAAKYVGFRELEQLIAADAPEYVPHPDEYKKLFPLLHERYR